MLNDLASFEKVEATCTFLVTRFQRNIQNKQTVVSYIRLILSLFPNMHLKIRTLKPFSLNELKLSACFCEFCAYHVLILKMTIAGHGFQSRRETL
jgi:hypothetical protein